MIQTNRHKCLIYEGHPSEQLPVIVPFLSRGLDDGRRCLYLGDPETVAMVERALEVKGIDVEAQKRRGALIFSSDRGHLDGAGFDPAAMVAGLRKMVEEAVHDGFQGLCATGDMKWELGPETNFERLLEYEALLERLFKEVPLYGICQYHKHTVPPRAVQEALISHRSVYVGAALSQDNFFYIPHELLTDGRDASLSAKRGEWMCEQILRILDAEAKRDRALADLAKANAELERRVAERTGELQALNKDLESFNYSVSHDLRAPLRVIDGFSRLLMKEAAGLLGGEAEKHVERIHASCVKMEKIIDDLLRLSKISRQTLKREKIDLAEAARAIVGGLKEADRERKAEYVAPAELVATGDPGLLWIALDNLLRNAWKFSSKTDGARIELGSAVRGGATVYFVKDNGAGFDMRYAGKLFGAFQRLHAQSEFPGLGVGLATVQRIVGRHGGRVWAESEVGKGAAFYFTLEPERPAPAA